MLIYFSLFFITKDIEAIVVISPWFSVKNSKKRHGIILLEQLNFCRWNEDSICKCTLLDFVTI